MLRIRHFARERLSCASASNSQPCPAHALSSSPLLSSPHNDSITLSSPPLLISKTMALTKTYLSFLLISLLSSPTSSQQCYYPSGNKTSTAYQPCSKNSADPLSTICCNPDLGDTCLPNGLCLVSGGYFWRKFCTQEDWTGGKCLDACISDVSISSSVWVGWRGEGELREFMFFRGF